MRPRRAGLGRWGPAGGRRLAALDARVHVVGRGKRRLDELARTDPALTGHQADGGLRRDRGGRGGRRPDRLADRQPGRQRRPGPIADLDLDMLRRAFDARFWGHLTTIQAALPRLSTDGSTTLLGAITARAAMPGTAGIAAVNAAVEALSRRSRSSSRRSG